jgi:hypothetical protein
MAVRVAVDAQNAGLALPHKLWPSDSWTNKHAEKCQECCRPSYSHSSAVSTTEAYTNFLNVPKGNNEGDSGLLNNLARILVLAFLPITQCRQSHVDFW